jgi:protease I
VVLLHFDETRKKESIMPESFYARREMLALLAAGPAAMGMFAASSRADERKPTAAKVLLPIGDATETMDTFYPFFRIAEEGIEVVVAGPEARLYHTVLHEVPPNSDVPWDITQERPSYHLKADIAFRDVNPDDYIGMFVSGGRAPEYLRYDQDLLKITRRIFAAKKPLGVTCHGIEIVSAAGVLKGKTCTTVGKCALDIEQGGGTYVDQPVVRQGHLITSRTWHDYAPFFHEFMKMLNEARRNA